MLVMKTTGHTTPLGSTRLVGSEPLCQLQLRHLRFRLGSISAQALSSHLKLSDDGLRVLCSFLAQMGERISLEHQHVLLGHTHLEEVLSLQLGDLFLVGDATFFPSSSDCNYICHLLEPLHTDFPEFCDLEDEDHDGDADEGSTSIEDIDEPGDEFIGNCGD